MFKIKAQNLPEPPKKINLINIVPFELDNGRMRILVGGQGEHWIHTLSQRVKVQSWNKTLKPFYTFKQDKSWHISEIFVDYLYFFLS